MSGPAEPPVPVVREDPEAALSAAERLAEAERVLGDLRDQRAEIDRDIAFFDDVAAKARAELAELVQLGDVIETRHGDVARDRPPKVGRRAVLPAGLEKHAAALEPLGLAVRTVTVPASTKTVYPTVAEIEKAEAKLRAAGVPLVDLIEPHQWGDPLFVVMPRERTPAP